MAKNRIITVQNIPITISEADIDDYICITDMAAAKSKNSRAADIVRNWLRNRATLEFLATWEEIETIKKYAFKVNEVLKAYFLQADIKLIDFKIEFGRFHGKILLADETSPDTCRLWDVHTNEKLDKDRFRRDLGNVEEAYNEVFKRLGLA